eukprot:TRINITY_DN14252_c0_g1_i1.p1 TRINITY_DN14252_c0_g1~~TRINITY_DN14252_c0_g1_i1.p1  ORF type:complete len:844 (+),score=135.79 TRINITY_DN14252_c0_g1_i1:146-2677(+)
MAGNESSLQRPRHRLNAVVRAVLGGGGDGCWHPPSAVELADALSNGSSNINKVCPHDVSVRLAAIRALGSMGVAARTYTTNIADAALSDENWQVRAEAAKALGFLYSDGTHAVAVGLAEPATTDSGQGVAPCGFRAVAASALVSAGNSQSELGDLDDSVDAAITDPCAGVSLDHCLKNLHVAIDALATALQADEHEVVRECAADAQGSIGSSICDVIDSVLPRAVVALANSLREDVAWNVRAAAARAIGHFRNFAIDHSSALICALQDDSAWQPRWCSASTIERLACDGVVLDDFEKERLAASCAYALFRDSSERVRIAATRALGALQTQRGEAALVAALKGDTAWLVRAAAARALAVSCNKSESRVFQQTGTARALASVVSTDTCEHVAVAATRALGALGQATVAYSSLLAAQLWKSSCSVSLRAAIRDVFWEATGSHGKLLADWPVDGFVWSQERLKAADALRVWSAAVANHAQQFATALCSNNAEVRAAGETALRTLGPAVAPFMAQLIIGSQDSTFEKRMAAMRGLSCTGVMPLDVACSFLTEWIYTPSAETIPVHGLELVALQRPEEDIGHHWQWAVLRSLDGHCFLVFRGSETVLDWIENSYSSLRGVEVHQWGRLLLHSGYWSALEGEAARLRAAVADVVYTRKIETLIICGGSKGGANALAAAIMFSLPRPSQQRDAAPMETADSFSPSQELVVVTFGTPNIVARGREGHESSVALGHLRAELRRRAPRSKAWVFSEDPVAALASDRSDMVISQFTEGSSYQRAMQFVKWLRPAAYKRWSSHFRDFFDVVQSFEPILPEVYLSLPTSRGGGKFDVSVHPQVNYTHALCRRLFCQS